jgi:hypothetical protein
MPTGTNLSDTVTLDGRPVEEATLQFYPADGRTSRAKRDANQSLWEPILWKNPI